jgi:L,D-transpeptidase ErfK/SrfK
MIKLAHIISMLIISLITLKFCCPQDDDFKKLSFKFIGGKTLINYSELNSIKIEKDITVAKYFPFIDSIVKKHDSLTPYHLTEHLLIRANPWIIDTLENTDYYRMKERDSFVYNQKKMIVLQKGSHIILPNYLLASSIIKSFQNTVIDVNIPEFKLRIIENSVLLYEFPIRVGRNEKKYLKMAGRILDLKTKTGSGYIVKHVRNPDYYNPANGHRYYATKRDDEKVTKLPQIPFIETEINGIRNGQLIHPTTNPETLNKPYSNGCIGTKEADAWIIYYYAPVGTKINIRYNLNPTNGNGDKLTLKNIYNYL